jgi:hypothetical protein
MARILHLSLPLNSMLLNLVMALQLWRQLLDLHRMLLLLRLRRLRSVKVITLRLVADSIKKRRKFKFLPKTPDKFLSGVFVLKVGHHPIRQR